jgi:hypothetical protein
MEAWGGTGGTDVAANLNPPYPGNPYTESQAVNAVQEYGSTTPYWDGGGTGANAPGYVAGTLAVTAGTVYTLTVGGNGKLGNMANPPFGGDGASGGSGSAGYNGGGSAGQSYQRAGHTPTFINSGGGGGGASDVRTGGTALANRILVAGGSGGSGAQFGNWADNGTVAFAAVPVLNGTAAPYYAAASTPYFAGTGSGMAGVGGYGGDTTGGGGERGTKADMSALASGVAAGGGTQAAGGAAGTDTETDGRNGTAGALGVGGNGGSYSTTPAVTLLGGGGGGGGYYGGGGGGSGHANSGVAGGRGGGGGGGSNFVGGSFTSTVNAAHLWSNIAAPAVEYQWTSLPTIFPGGAIRLTYSQPPDAPVIVTPGSFGRVPANQPFDITWIWSSGASVDLPTLGEGGAEITWTYLGVDTVTFVPPQIPGQAAQGKVLKFTVPASTLTAGRTYTLKIRQYDAAGAISAFSTTTSFRTVTAPTAATITAPAANADMTPSSFNVTWTSNIANTTQYLYRVKVTGLTTGAALDTGLLHAGSRVNLHPDSSMRTNNTASWTKTSGTLATDLKTDPWGTAACYKMTWTVKTRITIPVTTVPGVQYTFSGYWSAAASTDPAMALGAIDQTSGLSLGQSATQAVAGTPGNWQRLSVTFVATSGTTLFAFVPSGGSTSVNFFSSSMVEVGPTLGLYFGDIGSSKDPGVTGGTLSTNAFGNPIYQITDVLSATLGPWPNSTSEYVDVSLWISSLESVEHMTQTFLPKRAKVNLNPPGYPTATMAIDSTVGSISLHITAVDTPNGTTSIDIYRGVVGSTDPEVHLANVVPPPVTRVVDFVDYTPGSDISYAYRVRANSLSGGFEDTT